ncbi:MAG: hypothetical protein ACFFDT_24890, partial [Candidatus Hodarchaeota archaeon]
KIRIVDINGNVREFERETDIVNFGAGLALSGIYAFTDFLHIPRELVDWTLEKIGEFIDGVLDALEDLFEFVLYLGDLLLNFTIGVLEFIWEQFLSDALNAYRNTYHPEARASLELMMEMYNNGTVPRHITTALNVVLESPVIQGFNNTLTDIREEFDKYIPKIDADTIDRILEEYLGPFAILGEIASVIFDAIKWMGMKALEILERIYNRIIERLMTSKLKPIVIFLMQQYENFAAFVAKLNADLGIFPTEEFNLEDLELTDIIASMFNFLAKFANPAGIIQDALGLFSVENILMFMDLFVKDTPGSYTMADLLVDLFSPVASLGFILMDIIYFIGDIFSIRRRNVADLNIVRQSYRRNGFDYATAGLEITLTVIGGIKSALDNFLFRTIAALEQAGVGYLQDREISAYTDFIGACIGGVVGVINTLGKTTILVLKGIKDFGVEPDNTTAWLSVVEIVLGALDIIYNDLIVNVVKIIAGVLKIYLKLDALYEAIAFLVEIIGKIVTVFLNIVFGIIGLVYDAKGVLHVVTFTIVQIYDIIDICWMFWETVTDNGAIYVEYLEKSPEPTQISKIIVGILDIAHQLFHYVFAIGGVLKDILVVIDIAIYGYVWPPA